MTWQCVRGVEKTVGRIQPPTPGNSNTAQALFSLDRTPFHHLFSRP